MPVVCDIGLVQASPIDIDLEASREALSSFWPPDDVLLTKLAGELYARCCDGVVCDISPLGILASERAGIPVALVENFTWDWIYTGMTGERKGLQDFAAEFGKLFARVNGHIQAEPICRRIAGARSTDLIVRPLRQDRDFLRQTIGVREHQTLVLITMGGLAGDWGFLEALREMPEVSFLIPGLSERKGNVIGLGKPEAFYHPDWVRAADLVVGKLGYSTVAEVVQAGTPIAFVHREDFPESTVLANYVRSKVPAFQLESFRPTSWLPAVREYARANRGPERNSSGASQAAKHLLEILRPNPNPQS